MKLKKIVCLLLSLVMLLGVMVGCASKEETPAEDSTPAADNQTVETNDNKTEEPAASNDEIITLKLLTAGDEPTDLDMVVNAINEKLVADGLNINIDVSYFPWSDYQDKSATMIMAGEKVDLLLSFKTTSFDNYGNRLSLDLSDLYATYGTDIQKHISDLDIAAYTTTDGALVAIPAIYPKNNISAAMLYREDLRVKYGCEPITDMESFNAYCDAIVENEEGMYPFTRLTVPLSRAFGDTYNNVVVAHDDSYYAIELTEDGKYVAHSRYEMELSDYATAQLNAEMQSKGYMPSDAAQMDKETESSWFTNGKAAILNVDLFNFNAMEATIKQNIPEAELGWAILYPENGVQWEPSNNACSIASTCEHPEAAMQFINWLHADQANYDLYIYGIEGVHYTLTEDGSVQLPEGIDSSNNPYNATPWNFYNDQLHRSSASDNQITKDATAWWAGAKVRQAVAADFAFDSTNVALEVGQIASVTAEYLDPIYKGSADVSGWEDGLAKLEAAGINEYVAEVQRQLDEYYGQ